MSESKTFDPGRYLTKVGSADYLEVKWRLVWLREVHPDAVIETESVTITAPTANPEGEHDGYAVFKARVSIPGAGSATGYGSETYNDFREYIEKAETKAVGRALAALGFGTQFCDDFAFSEGARGGREKIVDSPVSSPKVPARSRSTSVGTIPNGIPDKTPPATVNNWTEFWDSARVMGMRTKESYQEQIGDLGSDPGYAYERLLAWRKDATVQKAMA